MATMLSKIILGVLDHIVAFLNHLGIFRNFNHVIVLNNKFTRGTPVYEKKRNTPKSAISDPSSPLFYL